MASRDFRVHVIKADGRQGIEIKSIGNFPDGLNDTEAVEHARKIFEHFFGNLGETYASIEVVGPDEDVAPRPGMFPPGFDRTVHQA